MAGKTLTGIGEDESGRHELAADTSDSAIRETKPQSTRSTDRMPMSTIIGMLPPSGILSGVGSVPAAPVPVAPVDDDKVAEGLKKLRSLDEPLGPIPSSMPTLKEGIPAVGSGTSTPAHPAAVAAAAAAELIRSRGTAHGHALSAATGGQGIMPVSVDDRMKGTLLGHSLHLPDLPEVVEESRPAEVRSIARVAPTGALTPAEMNTDFSHGDARFFESEPANTEFEPEKHVRQHRVMVRGLVIGGVAAIVVVGAIAWARAHKSESPAPSPVEARTPEPPPAPAAPDNAAAPTAAVPTPTPEPAPAAAATPPPAPPPAPTAAAPEEVAPAPVAVPTPARPPAHSRHEAAPATPRPAAHLSTHAHGSTEPGRETTKPAAVPGKRVKVEEDPDGTLPLDE